MDAYAEDWADSFDNVWDFMTDFFAIPVKWMSEKAVDAGAKYVGDKYIGKYFRPERIGMLKRKLNQTDWIVHILSLVVAASAEYYAEGKKNFSWVRMVIYYAGLYGFTITATQMIAFGKALDEVEQILNKAQPEAEPPVEPQAEPQVEPQVEPQKEEEEGL